MNPIQRTIAPLFLLGLAIAPARADDATELATLEALAAQTTNLIATRTGSINALAQTESLHLATHNAGKNANDANAQALGWLVPRGNALLAKTKPFSLVNGFFRVTAANLVLRHASSENTANNGLGNLIIGYNEAGPYPERDGSMNLILGPGHSYRGRYSLIAGMQNRVWQSNSAVLSGYRNEIRWNPESVILTGSENSLGGTRGVIVSGYRATIPSFNTLGLVMTGTKSDALGDGSVVLTGSELSARGTISFAGTGISTSAIAYLSSFGIGKNDWTNTESKWYDTLID